MKLTIGLAKLSVMSILTLMPTGGIFMIAGCRNDGATEMHSNFASPEEAGEALERAARANDQHALDQILGSDCVASLSSGNLEEDNAALASFAVKYERMNRWVSMTDGSKALYIGPDNYQFPVPLVQRGNSKWHFASDAGKDEILARRVGENELRAVDIALAIAGEEGIPAQDSERILSGYLFRAVVGNRTNIENATDSRTRVEPVILASPIRYADSGVMTFLIGKDGHVYEKDLGPSTPEVARTITLPGTGEGWIGLGDDVKIHPGRRPASSKGQRDR